ncbi:MAG: amidohydrolase family protein [Lapillicoccus sp.]
MRLVPIVRSVGPPPTREAVDVVVSGGAVTAVGADLPVPPGARVVDAGGRWLIPGLWDHHVHMTQWATTAARLDLSGTAGHHEVLARVAAHLPSLATESTTLVGYGYRSGGWPRPVSTADLDAVCGGHPVVLVAGDGHNGWLSSSAQRLFGVEPRDGAFDETDWFPLWAQLALLLGSPAEIARGLDAVMTQASAQGVVGIVDMEFDDATGTWPGRFAAGLNRLRVRTSVYAEGLDGIFAAGLRTGDVLDGTDGLATMGPFKIISDGSLGTRTAHTHEPYSPSGAGDPAYPHGKQNVSQAELTELLEAATVHGLDVAVHTIGDAAAQIALDAVAASGARGSIEHAQLMTRDEIVQMARLGLRASVQPAHLLDDRDLTVAIWPGREERCFMLRTMLALGVELAFGSDAPVARLDPWLAMAAAVHRTGDAREPWVPEEQLTAPQALAASVDGRGTVAVGDVADLALLDADPLAGETPAESAAALRAMRVAATLVAGRLTHDGL